MTPPVVVVGLLLRQPRLRRLDGPPSRWELRLLTAADAGRPTPCYTWPLPEGPRQAWRVLRGLTQGPGRGNL